MSDRQRPRDDRELEEMTGITPADHNWVSPATIRKAERELLGGRLVRRVETDEERQRRLGKPFGC